MQSTSHNPSTNRQRVRKKSSRPAWRFSAGFGAIQSVYDPYVYRRFTVSNEGTVRHLKHSLAKNHVSADAGAFVEIYSRSSPVSLSCEFRSVKFHATFQVVQLSSGYMHGQFGAPTQPTKTQGPFSAEAATEQSFIVRKRNSLLTKKEQSREVRETADR